MFYGYNGKLLHVDLNTGKLAVEEPGEEFFRKYVGGSAIGTYFALKNTPANIDPLDPRNTLTFAISVVTGAPISGQSRISLVAKSPLTGVIGHAQGGGFFPAKMKESGFEAIVVTGKSEKPVYLFIKDGKAELRDASALWGKVTGEVDRLVKEDLGDPKVEILQCGPAGENLVLYSSVMSMSNRAAGRTGMGAVMGSKNLKAIVAAGGIKQEYANPNGIKALRTWAKEHYDDSIAALLNDLGTACTVGGNAGAGGLPTNNWAAGIMENWEAIDGITMRDTNLKENDTCFSCVVQCKRVVEETGDGKYTIDPYYGGPEYETLGTLGSYCGIDNLNAVCYANQLCNMYGLDTISTGATISWLMDCYEHGVVKAEDIDGIELNFGNYEGMVALVEKIAKREGIGDLLALGSARAAEKLGGKEFLVASKKQEYPAHMPQVKPSLGLTYAAIPTGADHMSNEHDASYSGFPERARQIGLIDPQPAEAPLNREKINYALTTQYAYSFMDTATVCQFCYGLGWQFMDMAQLAGLVADITGWEFTPMDIVEVGKRTLNMQRAFNARDGVGREYDTSPAKKMLTPLKGGPSDGFIFPADKLEEYKDIYFELAGWDKESGNPTNETLETVGLEWIAEMR